MDYPDPAPSLDHAFERIEDSILPGVAAMLDALLDAAGPDQSQGSARAAELRTIACELETLAEQVESLRRQTPARARFPQRRPDPRSRRI